MRVLCLFPIFRSVSSGMEFFGAERQFIEICKRWAMMGNELHIIGTHYSISLCKKYRFKPFKGYACKYTWFKFMGIEDFVNIERLCRTIPSETYDFIYCPNESFEYVFPSVVAKKRLGSSLVVSVNLFHPNDINIYSSFKMALEYASYRGLRVHLKSMPERFLFVFKKSVRTSFLKKADLIFAISKYLRDLLLKAGIDGKRIHLTASGIDCNYISSVHIPERKTFDACFIGAIIPRKGVFDLVRAWLKVIKVKPHAKLVIIGHGSGFYYNKIKEFVLNHNLQNNVVITGFVSERKKYELLKQSKIFIFPSYLESFSQVICEALACGVPVIAYNLPVFKEFYGQSILYVDVGDVEKVATKTIELLENEDLRREMGQAGYNVARRYDWENIAKQQIEIIKKHLQL